MEKEEQLIGTYCISTSAACKGSPQVERERISWFQLRPMWTRSLVASPFLCTEK